jgi:hypothetical protein
MSAEAAKAYYAASAPTHPIGRVGTPQDIAEMVLFLADPSKAGQESSRNIFHSSCCVRRNMRMICRIHHWHHHAGGRRPTAYITSCSTDIRSQMKVQLKQ